MEIVKNITVPTGNILITQGEHGLLECLSIGDYGKEANLKADFLGLTKDIHGVENNLPLLPLEKKWVVTISSQYGCSMGCTFCDVPKVGPGRNATFRDLLTQVALATSLHPEIQSTERLNLHYARMGEPTFNRDVIYSALVLSGIYSTDGWGFHPVVSTMMPRRNIQLKTFIKDWMHLKNNILNGNAGLQVSVNTTDYKKRKEMFNDEACTLSQIANILGPLVVKGRKIALNIALTDAHVDAKLLASMFDPGRCLIKITPMHLTTSCQDNKLFTGTKSDDYGYSSYYPYQRVEEELKEAGFDVIVFIPSMDEDSSRITCGNAILSDKEEL